MYSHLKLLARDFDLRKNALGARLPNMTYDYINRIATSTERR